jgi:hypothetical protein
MDYIFPVMLEAFWNANKDKVTKFTALLEDLANGLFECGGSVELENYFGDGANALG